MALWKECPQIKIFINGNKLKQRDQFKYKGSLKSNDRCNIIEIASRIGQAKMSLENKKSILTNNHISIHTRKRVLECYIETILIYEGGLRKFPKKLDATGMWFLWKELHFIFYGSFFNDRFCLG